MENVANEVTPELRLAYLDKLARTENEENSCISFDWWLLSIMVATSQTFLWTVYFYEKRMKQQKLFYDKLLHENRLIITEMNQINN
jgi:hypothetical protein